MDTKLFSKEEDVSFWKNLILIGIFFTIAPITLGVSLFSLLSLKSVSLAEQYPINSNLIITPQSGVKVYASLPSKIASVSGEVGSSDARIEIVKKYLTSYGSPLAPLADFIVITSDKYSLDYRLTTAIAQQESNLCKVIPPGSYNCWGWGITSVGTLGFKSYQAAIEEVSKGLRENYLNKGFVTIADIMSKYTPQSNGSWAIGVNQFMSEMQ